MKDLLIPKEESGILIFKNTPYDFEDKGTVLVKSKIGIFLPSHFHDKSNNLERPLTIYFEEPHIQHLVCFGFKFTIDVITVDLDGLVNNIFRQPQQTSTSNDIRTFTGIRMVILFNSELGIINKFNIKKNRTRIELTDSHNLINIYQRKKWVNYLKSKSDLELIDTFNGCVGIRTWCFALSVYVDVLRKEIKSRSFNSDILFTIMENGLESFHLGKKVKLVNNKLIHIV